KVRRPSVARDVSIAVRVDGDAAAAIGPKSAQHRPIKQSAAAGIEFQEVSICITAAGALKGAGRGGKSDRPAAARYIGAPAAVNRDAFRRIVLFTAYKRRVNQTAALRVELEQNAVKVSATISRREGPGRSRKICGRRID